MPLRKHLRRLTLVGLSTLTLLTTGCAPEEPEPLDAAPPGGSPPTLDEVLARPADALAVEQDADGTLRADLAGTYQHAHLVRIRPDGTLELACVTDAEAAKQFLSFAPHPATEAQ